MEELTQSEADSNTARGHPAINITNGNMLSSDATGSVLQPRPVPHVPQERVDPSRPRLFDGMVGVDNQLPRFHGEMKGKLKAADPICAENSRSQRHQKRRAGLEPKVKRKRRSEQGKRKGRGKSKIENKEQQACGGNQSSRGVCIGVCGGPLRHNKVAPIWRPK